MPNSFLLDWHIQCVSEKNVTLLIFCDNCQISSDFANFWQKHSGGNLQHDLLG